MDVIKDRLTNILNEVKKIDKSFYEDVICFIESLQRKEIPSKMPFSPDIFDNFTENNLKKDTTMMYLRNYCQSIGLYGIVTKDYCKSIKENIGDKKILEVMSGRGFLSKGLADEGVNIIATDDFSWNNVVDPVYGVENLSAIEAVRKYKDKSDVLLISWPPYDKYEINEVIQEWGSKKNIIYIGKVDGCCANDEFFNMLSLKESKTKQSTFSGLHDKLYDAKLKKKYDLSLKEERNSKANKLS